MMYLCREQLPLILLLVIFVLNKVTPPLHHLQTELKIQVDLRSKGTKVYEYAGDLRSTV